MTASNPSPPTSKSNAWDRWAKIWHAVFYVTLGLPTLLALVYGDPDQSLVLILGLSLALCLWYAFMIIWLLPKLQGNVQQSAALVFLIGALVLWIPLANSHPAYYLTASSFYGLMWGTLRFGVAIAGNVILTVVIILLQSLSRGGSLELSANLLIIGAVIVGWSVLLALWIRTIMRESVERKRLIDKLEAAQDELAAVERQAGIQEERQRMSHEIHDTLAQGFTSIVMQLEAADQALPEETETAHDHILKARDTARTSLKEARRLVLALQPEPLEKAPLAEALHREAERWSQDNEIDAVYSITGTPISLHPQVEVTLLRAMQEGLANVHKHAGAGEVNVTLSYMADQVALDIQDDGAGFEVSMLNSSTRQENGGYGLRAMRQRVGQIGGTVILESTPGQGTTLAIQIPIADGGDGDEYEHTSGSGAPDAC
jgi:signal transduction histidine kinase